MSIHILGIRHHGPGSARNVLSFLEELQPDLILVEGPPEADALLSWVTDPALRPPVALLCYQPDDLQNAVFYPFAEFSPEWQAIRFARMHHTLVRFFDLPIVHQLAVEKDQKEPALTPQVHEEQPATEQPVFTAAAVRADPILSLAQAAGWHDSEKWWEHMFEHRLRNEQVFDAVQEAMQALRSDLPLKEDRLDLLREAHMRKMIRQAEKDLHQRVAVICGAWHVPALLDRTAQKEDHELLKGLPKIKIECTWVPWTYSRLSYQSGYGAGIQSPGWYEHVWSYPYDDGTRWMSRVATLFRQNGMDTSVAHVIEAVRLAASLAALRNLSKPGLEELNEATLSVLCNGEAVLLRLISEELIVGPTLGAVPDEIPKPPLQVDIEKQQKKLRLPPAAEAKDYTLDLRNETDLGRSIFLHRLRLLEIRWGQQQEVSGKGTFKELWHLQYDPSFSIDIIEKGVWGNTVEKAAAFFVIDQSARASTLARITTLLEQTLPAELHPAVEVLVEKLNNLAAASGDVIQLMEAVAPLVSVSRYGNVRKTDSALVLTILESMITRICVSLPNAVTAIDEQAARHLLDLFYQLDAAVGTLQQPGQSVQWQGVLKLISRNPGSSPVIAGYAVRLLADHKLLEKDELVTIFSQRMSRTVAAGLTSAWLEGFLRGSGTMLLLDEAMWSVVNNWVAELEDDLFMQVLPLLRRTFSAFTGPEKRKLGEKVRSGTHGTAQTIRVRFDETGARRGIPVVLQFFGYQK